jgi:hypothetical protein
MKRIKEKLTANILPKGDRLMLSSEDQKTRWEVFSHHLHPTWTDRKEYDFLYL